MLRVANQLSRKVSSDEDIWKRTKGEFLLDEGTIHLSLPVIAPHPKKVREAIERHRTGFDTNPGKYFKNKDNMQRSVLESVAKYLETSPNSIALTESTTMGLSVVYGGMQLEAGEEILTTDHEHYACSEILRFKARDSKCILRKISLYNDSSRVKKEEILGNIFKNITKATRVIAITWVHSSTGVKIPLSEIGDGVKKINQSRSAKEKILLCVDGLHGLGVENFSIENLNCDFFVAGCHKSLFGPRGTGIVWGSALGWNRVNPTITSFDVEVFWPWFEGHIPDLVSPKARLCSPGGFAAFEHKWALSEAFDFHLGLGKDLIQKRIHELNTYAKEIMKPLSGIQVLTPFSESLSSGMICFNVNGMNPKDVVEFFEKENIIICQTPYRNTCSRFCLGILNNYDEIDKAIDVLKKCILSAR